MGRDDAWRIGIAGIGLLALAGCMPWDDDDAAKQKVAPGVKAQALAAEKAAAQQAKVAAAARVKANELGQIPVLMYHRVVEKVEAPDDLTYQQFRAELERLAREGYVPITAREYVTGRIDVPAGKHPVVLTFDDSSPAQLALDGEGNAMPNTALGILIDVAKRHPGFRPVATMYVTRDMFGRHTPEERAEYLMWLQDKGFDIGNHTHNHINLRGRPKNEVFKEIVAGHRLIIDVIRTPPATIAVPYGNQPSTKSWARRGSSGGVSYDYGGVMLAGYTPAPSPFAKDFDPLGIPRIRSFEKKGDCVRFCSVAWLDWLKQNPDKRYTSDGDVTTVAYPKFKSPFAARAYAKYALPY